METTSGLHWGDPEKTGSAFDCRSDTVTPASTSTFEAIRHATLNDDVYGEGQTTTAFERQIAKACGKEAAVFVVSGTMANQLALRALLPVAPHGVLADSRAHIVNFESGGLGLLSVAMVQAVNAANGRHLTLDDIVKRLVPMDAKIEKCPTSVISIENTSHASDVPLE
ncbi:L-allo-threonine aldolase [Colletotrichum tofieldiae]|nr:L-allo-threonine aldolase [Colletotrichum tofieldiae]GKT68617.1 L-allo-threonine aldolase [Colletotrichum tofieldiae]